MHILGAPISVLKERAIAPQGRKLVAIGAAVGLVASTMVGAIFEREPERAFSETVTAEQLQAQVLEGAAATDKSSAIQFLRGQGYSQAEAHQLADEMFDDPNSSLLASLFGGDSESAEGTGARTSSLSSLLGLSDFSGSAPLAMSAPLAAAPLAMSAPVGANRVSASLPMGDPAAPADSTGAGSSSGTQITRFELQWQSADDVDNGDPDLLYRKPSGDSLSDAVLQLVYGVQGERDYEPGEFTITIPAKNFTLRDVSTGEDAGRAGSLTIPYPEAPRKTKDFQWQLVGDNYVITNTRTLSAATKGYIELGVSYKDAVHNLRDMAKYDFQAHLEVVAPGEELLVEDSNVVQMQVDSYHQITSLTKRTTEEHSILHTVDASEIPEAQRIPGEEKYYVVNWTLRVAHQGNQPYQLDLTDTISDEYGGFILEATDSSGRKLEKNVFEGWSAPSSNQYFYVKSAYPASRIDNGDRTCGIKHVYATVRNDATMKLTPFDRVDDPTSRSASYETRFVYYKSCPYFGVVGNIQMCKRGNDGEKYGFSHQASALDDCPEYYTKRGGNYVTALNRLRDGEDVQIDYDADVWGTLLPWTRDGNERVLADYGKKNVTLVWTDTGVQMLNEQGVKAGRDFDFTSVGISKPQIGKAYSSGLNPDGSFIEDWDDPKRYIGATSDTNPAHIPVIVLEAKVGAKWQKVADVDYTSGSCQVQYANGSTSTDCAHIALPEKTTQLRTSVTTNVASIDYTVRPKVTLYATDAMRQLAAQSFEDTRIPVRYMRNNATLVATGEDGSKIATLNRFGEDNLWGYSAESEVKLEKKAHQKSVNYNDGYVTLGYTATGVERWDAPDVVSDHSQERLWNELVEIGEIEPLPSGVWYDLLPKGVYPILNSVTVNTEVSDGNGRKVTTPGTIAGVRTVPDWQGTGRMMLIVDMDYPQEKYSTYKRNGFLYYEQPISVSFDARYDFDSIKDYGKNTHNVIAFEAGKDTYGSIEGLRGEEDSTAGSHHSGTAAAFKNDVERGALDNLNPDHDNPVFVYAGVSQAVSALSAANTGLDKKVMANNDGIWGPGTYGEDIDVWEGGTYSYRLRLTSGNETISKDLILYDSLENFYAGASNDEVDVDAPRWNGTFKSIDVSSLEAKGVKPVVYYSTVPNLRLDDANNPKLPNAQNVDLTNSAVWSTTPPSDLSKVTAIAIDASKKADGSDFELQPKESISVVMRMAAPSGEEGARAIEQDAHAYNNAFMVATSIDTKTGIPDEKSFVRHDYTKVGIKEFSLDVTKQWDDDNNRDGIRPDSVTVHLLANGRDTGKSLTLKAEDSWQGTFAHLPYTDDAGVAIEYTVQEQSVAGYTSRVGIVGEKMTIRNTHTPERISLSGEKSWANASANVLPASISVVLYADGKVAQRKTVKPDASGKWKYEFTNLYKYRDGGQEIVYTLGEQKIGEDWISRVEGMNIVNTYHPYGDALVSKVVRGAPERYADTEFSFKLSLLDSSGKALAGSYAFETSDGRTGTIKHGSTFRLKDGQSLRIKELPKGTVVRSVENALPEGSMFEIVGSSEQSTTVKSNAEVTATHTNAFTAGDAVISKQVEGVPERYAAKYADMEFSFKVSLLNGETPVSGSFEFETSDGRTGTIKHGDTVTLRGGQSLRIKELPKGVTVRSEETLPADSAFENNGVQEKPIKPGAVVTLGHVNEYRFGDAVLSKRLEGVPEAYAAKYADMEFSFKVSLLAGENPVSGSFEFETSDGRTGTVKHGDTVTLRGGQSLRIKELPKGVTVRSEEVLPQDSVFTANSDGAYVGVVAASQDVPLESVNTYNRSDAVLSKKVENATGVTGTLDFSFTISLLDSEDNVLTGQYEWESSDGRTGKIAHNGTLTLKDGQSVRIKELPMGAVVRTEEADMPGFTAQGGTVKSATVKANEDAAIAYTNVYKAEGSISLEASKELTGQPLRRGQFIFEVYNESGALVRAAGNDADGIVTFGALRYTQADSGKTYTYTVKEKNTGAGGIKYDERTYQARVTVNDNGDGTLSPTVEYVGVEAGAKPNFVNEYRATGEAALKAWKTLGHGTLEADQFSFDLFDASGEKLQTKTNAADGAIDFDPIQFNETHAGKTFLYVIREQAGDDPNITYDTASVFGYQLEVVDQRDGTLGFNLSKVKVKPEGDGWVADGETDDDAVFKNEMKPGALSVEKRTTDGSSDEPFRFKVKLTGEDVPTDGNYNFSMNAVDNSQMYHDVNRTEGTYRFYYDGRLDIFSSGQTQNSGPRFVCSGDNSMLNEARDALALPGYEVRNIREVNGRPLSFYGYYGYRLFDGCTQVENFASNISLQNGGNRSLIFRGLGADGPGVENLEVYFRGTVDGSDNYGAYGIFEGAKIKNLQIHADNYNSALPVTPFTNADIERINFQTVADARSFLLPPGVWDKEDGSVTGIDTSTAAGKAAFRALANPSGWWVRVSASTASAVTPVPSLNSTLSDDDLKVVLASSTNTQPVVARERASATEAISTDTNASLAKPSIFASLRSALAAKLPSVREKSANIKTAGQAQVVNVFDVPNGTATFYDDGTLELSDGLVVSPDWWNEIIYLTDRSHADWCTDSSQCINDDEITAIKGNNIVLNDGVSFAYMRSLKDIGSMATWNTSNVTDMSGMFEETAITDVSGLANWDTSNVTDMSRMFSYTLITNVDGLASWDVSKVTNISEMFYVCTSLSNIDGLASWDVSNVTDMSKMFGSYTGYGSWLSPNRSVPHSTNLNALANWKTSSLTNMRGMFSHNDMLEDISALANWDTSHVTNMSELFYDNDKLADVNALANWDTSSLANTQQMFYHCDSLSDITGLSNWDTSNVTNMSSMFGSAEKLSDISALAHWDTSKVTTMGGMFAHNRNLVDISPLATWNVSAAKDACSYYYSPLMYVGATDFSVIHDTWQCGSYYGSDVIELYKEGYFYSDTTHHPSTVKIHGTDMGIDVYAHGDPYIRDYRGVWYNVDTGKYATDGVDGILTGEPAYNGVGYDPSLIYLTGEGTWQRMVRLSYDPAGATYGSKAAEEVHAGSDYQLPSAKTFRKQGHALTGWLLKEKGASDDNAIGLYKPGATIPASEMTKLYPYDFELVAQWEPVDSVITIKDGEFEFELYGGEKATFDNIPAGTAYEVYEMTPKGWVLVQTSGTSGTIPANDVAQASFVNQPIKGVTSLQLEASKLLDGVGAEADAFEFTLTDGTHSQTVKNSAGGAIHFKQILVYDDSDSTGMTEAQALARIPASLRENAFALYPASALPNLTITEVAGTDRTINYDEREIEVTLKNPFTLADGEQAVEYSRAPVFENTTKPASLQVTKNVVDAPSGDASEFTVQIALSEGSVPLADTSGITAKIDSENVALTWSGGVTTVKLAGGQTVELNGIPAGVSYTVSETDMPKGWEQRSINGESGTLIAGETSTATVTNAYGSSGKINLEAYKSLVGRELLEDEFTFDLFAGENPAEGATPLATVENLSPDIRNQIYDEEHGEWIANPHKNHAFVAFDDIEIKQAGTYKYTIRERVGDDESVNYDGRSIVATVKATDNKDGTLSFDVTYSGGKDGANLFENTVKAHNIAVKKVIASDSDPIPASYEDAVFLMKLTLSGGTDWASKNYALSYSAGSAGGAYRPSVWNTTTTSGDTTTTVNEITVGVRAGETVAVEGLYAGTQYSVEEIGWALGSTENKLGEGFSYVSGNAAGTVADSNVTVTVTNRYDEDTPPNIPSGKTTKAIIKAHKHAENYRLQGDDFTFELVDFDGNVIDTATNAAGGEVVFAEITLSEADLDKVHTYYIREQVGENASGRWQYDEKNHKVDIVTEKDEGGELVATVYYDTDEEPTFTNTYIEPVGYLALRADKEVTGEGAELAEGDFTFELRDSIGHTIATATNEADGSVWFPTITYGAQHAGKEFTYQIVEIAGDKAGWTYDEHVETVKVRVSDTGEAMLVVEATYDVGADFTADPATASSDTDTTFGALFVNSYDFNPPIVGVHLSNATQAALLLVLFAGLLGAGYTVSHLRKRGR